jgi:GT2 family glycosyltransferase
MSGNTEFNVGKKEKMMRIAVLMTCFNRKQYTLGCLKTIIKDIPENIKLTIYLVNDGCTDGTPEAVREQFPQVRIIDSDGTLFWNRGMHCAFKTALKESFDFYIWINDDVVFYPNVVSKLVKSYESVQIEDSIIVGYTLDTFEKEITYSAFRRKKGFLPMTMERVQPGKELVEADTFHGNCVLIPACVVKKIGLNDPYYHHGFGDGDYGLTATSKGCKVYLTNYPVGVCDKNDANWSITRDKMKLSERYKKFNSVKQRPVKEWKYYTRKFGGPFWWLRFASPYIKIFVSHIKIMMEGNKNDSSNNVW